MSEDESRLSKNDSKIYKVCFSTSTMIDMIRDRPCLWNKLVPDYRDRSARMKAWEEIYSKLEPSYDELESDVKAKIGQQITKKWFNVRDAYLKSIKDVKYNRKPYVYTDQISFVKPFLSSEKHEDTTYLEEEHLIDEQSDQLSEPSFIYVDTFDNPRKRRKHDYDNASVKKEARESEEFVEDNSLVGGEEDPEKAFFTSIVPVVKTLTVEARLEFQIEVLKLLKKIKKKDLNGEEFD